MLVEAVVRFAELSEADDRGTQKLASICSLRPRGVDPQD
jgi:hypothetical protein